MPALQPSPTTPTLNPALRSFWLEPARNRVLYGGRDSSKSWDAAGFAVFLAQQCRIRVCCARQFQNKIAESVYTLLKIQIERFGLMGRYKSKVIEDARTALTANTSIDQDRKSGVITLSVVDKSPDFASKLAHGYVTELNRIVTEDSTSAARRERMFLEDRLKVVKQDLDDSSRALSQFSTKNQAIDIPNQAKSMVDAGLRLQELLAEGRGQLAALRQTYSEGNERIKVIQARNAELERQIREMGGTPGGAGKPVGADQSLYPSMSQLPILGVTYFDLERKVRVDEAVWETLTKQYEMAKVQEAKEIPTVRVLDEANVPNRKYSPHRSIIMIVGTLLAIVLSCIVVLGLSKWESMDADAEPKMSLLRAYRKVRKV